MATERPPFAVEPEVMAILEVLWSAGHGAYLVGGGVRDRLLGMTTTDWDIATDARPERLLELFPGSTYENRFGTVQARGVEITTFRRDHRYADHRRPERVTFSDDIYEDLARRDLTINAIAWGRRGPDAPGRLVDPADGQGDLMAGVVRAVGDPAQRFEEDALRMLRAVRIAARLDFTIEPVTLAAIRAHAADIAWVSGERVGSEIRRLLRIDRPSRAFRLLLETDLLARTLPELDALADASDARSSPFDRTLAALDTTVDAAPGRERAALATLVVEADPGSARRALERLYVGTREADASAAIASAARVPTRRSWSDAEVRRFMHGLTPELLDDVLVVRRSRASAHEDDEAVADEAGLRERVEDQRRAGAPLALADLAIDGRDLREALGLPEGPTIGRILDRLLDDVLDDPALNTRATLLTRASLALEERGVAPGGSRGDAAID